MILTENCAAADFLILNHCGYESDDFDNDSWTLTYCDADSRSFGEVIEVRMWTLPQQVEAATERAWWQKDLDGLVLVVEPAVGAR
ncbi:hypothetical protein PRIC1_003950 [Phytophthora ramorum]|uniref:uncharacterized protein n=1 Tax=Phytophthora ramorum TaxID=164328 RepID=UPI00309F052D|nr:hypothetical protein KRP23_3695 [Phytophthora ramorum]KAH7507973.1 hypothetical protein KRP22_3067 [Phytophthora ramorum]